ncbi:HEAT repeat-containing protein [Singulisphaera sp. GP187]|uniref:HEAT repeat domain-containing protein n=1 Tax=Singulisphaera sp. GP187 TaxID=1882752 RepID=UPI00092CAF4A|nr:HEAT repeat domain-containing protein [Singulisphaera sp. GP187]SIO03695.1 HEAT repeat-containing protein [Singulisphaera sp. GP187]
MFRLSLVGLCLLTALGADSPARVDLSAYEAAAAKVGPGADAHVRLALWCEAQGLQTERLKHLAIAVQIQPGHAIARGLLAQMTDEGRWRRPEDVAARYRARAAEEESLNQYRRRRDALPDTAEAHWQLAGWCAEQGLESEAVVHLLAVVRIDPAREDAWKKLGYRKQNGRWKSVEQAASERADADAQRTADLHWRPLLQKWKSRLSQNSKKGKPTEVDDALPDVTDPRAVPSIWKAFANGGPDDQQRVVALLRQLDSPTASRALATLALFGASPEVRRLAAESLTGRDPREFADLLIAVLRDPVKYEVRPVAGPGSPGELYIHGKRANTRRFYAAPPSLATLRPSDVVGFDNNGLPVANRAVGSSMLPLSAIVDQRQMGTWDLTGASEFFGNKLAMGDAGRRMGASMVKNQRESSAIGSSIAGRSSAGFVAVPLVAQIPVGQLMLQAEQQAALAQQRLQTDVAELDAYNKDVNQVNERATFVLKAAVGEDLGAKQEDWLMWWSDLAKTTSAPPLPGRERAGTGRLTGRQHRASADSFVRGRDADLDSIGSSTRRRPPNRRPGPDSGHRHRRPRLCANPNDPPGEA